MKAKKILSAFCIAGIVLLLTTALIYHRLTSRNKAVAKGIFLYKTGLADKNWQLRNNTKKYTLTSPDFLIDGIYKSMEGPTSMHVVELTQDTALIWLTGFKVQALDAKTKKKISNDFVCHTNFDLNEVKYYDGLHLKNRIGTKYPRVTSLSHGMESFHFPKGYGVPMRGNDLLNVTTESLNHNIKDTVLWVKHQVDIEYSQQELKPLMFGSAFIMLPYDEYDPYKEPMDPSKNYCIPIETGAHNYKNSEGKRLSGHWVIPKGKNTYRSSANTQLQIKDSLRLHAAAIHVHPFATSITLFDKTKNAAVFTSNIVNFKDRIGIESIEPFSSEEGIWLYKSHEYEVVLTVDNTTHIDQDMMGTMFLFFYDSELDALLHHRSKTKKL
ncbi:hypothetical protein [Flavobacterium pallidum]|uniref:Uncharacterized protein n=1 Tax=Flavobacterium pallidum TaxID=2172098 RepID=A0A2S1SDE7_9FLAO|nr:hypothetical protein [Flavobacterium pallidum]AWI24417.1 hypothetical protein HYN49_00095 [Flavobacterium pallidum]